MTLVDAVVHRRIIVGVHEELQVLFGTLLAVEGSHTSALAQAQIHDQNLVDGGSGFLEELEHFDYLSLLITYLF